MHLQHPISLRRCGHWCFQEVATLTAVLLQSSHLGGNTPSLRCSQRVQSQPPWSQSLHQSLRERHTHSEREREREREGGRGREREREREGERERGRERKRRWEQVGEKVKTFSHRYIIADLIYTNLHAVPSCQVSVYHFHASKILHSLSNLNAHIQQLFTDHLHLQ